MQNLWAVSRSGLVPPRKHDIQKETAKTGWYRLSDYSEHYHGYACMHGGVKQCFVL